MAQFEGLIHQTHSYQMKLRNFLCSSIPAVGQKQDIDREQNKPFHCKRKCVLRSLVCTLFLRAGVPSQCVYSEGRLLLSTHPHHQCADCLCCRCGRGTIKCIKLSKQNKTKQKTKTHRHTRKQNQQNKSLLMPTDVIWSWLVFPSDFRSGVGGVAFPHSEGISCAGQQQ